MFLLKILSHFNLQCVLTLIIFPINFAKNNVKNSKFYSVVKKLCFGTFGLRIYGILKFVFYNFCFSSTFNYS